MSIEKTTKKRLIANPLEFDELTVGHIYEVTGDCFTDTRGDTRVIADHCEWEDIIEEEPVLPSGPSGGSENTYYQADVQKPLREDSEPYLAECYDIIIALNMSWDQANAFKAIWRSAASEQGNGKQGIGLLYDAQKIVFYGKRMLSKARMDSK